MVSVIIPTFRDWNRLKLCIESILNQTYTEIEIIIVNNDASEEFPKEFCDYPSCLRFIEEKKAGSYSARNAAIAIAKGEILAFTDSDCIADPDWLKNGLLQLNDGIVEILAGKISMFSKENNDNFNLVEIIDLATGFRQEYYVNRYKFGVTGNLFVKRKVFEKIGLFNENLMSGGDYEFCNRAVLSGFKIAYSNNAVINHPLRNKRSDIINKSNRIIGGILSKQNYLTEKLGTTFKLLLPQIENLKLIFKLPKVSISKKIKAAILFHFVRLNTFKEAFEIIVFRKKPIR